MSHCRDDQMKKVTILDILTSLKKSLAQMFSCEFWEISKNTFFTEQLQWLLLKVLRAFEKNTPYHFLGYIKDV